MLTADEIVRSLYLAGKLATRDAVDALCVARGLVMHTFSRPNATSILITLSRAAAPDAAYGLTVDGDRNAGPGALLDATREALDEKLKKIP